VFICAYVHVGTMDMSECACVLTENTRESIAAENACKKGVRKSVGVCMNICVYVCVRMFLHVHCCVLTGVTKEYIFVDVARERDRSEKVYVCMYIYVCVGVCVCVCVCVFVRALLERVPKEIQKNLSLRTTRARETV